MESFKDLKTRILSRRPLCEVCYERRATQLHHCLVHDMKRYHTLLTVEENLMPICDMCHVELSQKGNDMATKVDFAYRQKAIYNYDIGKWYRQLPLKVKEHWLLNQ